MTNQPKPHNPDCKHLEIKPTIRAVTSVMAIQFNLYGFECVACDKNWDVGDAVDALRQLAEKDAQLAAMRDAHAMAVEVRTDWLGEKTAAELEKSWPAMKRLVDFAEHGGTPDSWRAWLAHDERKAAGEKP